MRNDKEKIESFQIVLFILPFMYGLFYEYTSYISCAILCIYLMCIVNKRRVFKISINYSTIGISIMVLAYLISIIYAVDRGVAFSGFLKISIVLVFLLILMQLKTNEIEKGLNIVPYSGAAMTVISGVTFFIPKLKENFYQADRLGGFFQYSNTFALFLLIGLVILINNEEFKKKERAVFSLELIGIFLTGSRFIFVITIMFLLLMLVKKKELRIFIPLLLVILLGIGVIVALVTGSYQNLGRFLTISTSSSTLIGRLHYYIDAVKLIIRYPLGLGYMGYSYMQPEIKTGPYTTLFVHNDFLQIALDAGILALIVFVGVIFKNLRDIKVDKVQGQILMVIIIAGLFDFNFEFMIIPLILLMTLDINSCYKVIEFRKKKVLERVYITSILSMFIYIYFSIAFFASYKEYNSIAVELYKYNTNAQEMLIIKSNSKEDVEALANDILKRNKMSYISYDAKALVCAINGEYEEMSLYKEKAISINKYSMNEYNEYVDLLKSAIDYYERINDKDSRQIYINKVLEVPQKLRELEVNTSALAYKVQDKPNFKLDNGVMDYIELLS